MTLTAAVEEVRSRSWTIFIPWFNFPFLESSVKFWVHFTGGLQVPRSPVTPTFPPAGFMRHVIEHRFTKSFSFRVATCDYCQKQMIIGEFCGELYP
jgi:hypothetical protein